MDLLRRCFAGVVCFRVDRAACADRLDCCLGIFDPGRGPDCSDGLAIRLILRGDAIQHRRWMIRSYALTAAAITLRIYLPLVFVFHWPFAIGYPAIAWLCCFPNVIAVEL